MAHDPAPTAHPEGERPVGGDVGDRGDEQGQEVRELPRHRELEEQVQQRVGDRRRDADRGEPHHLPEEAGHPRRFKWMPPQLGVHALQRDAPGRDRPADPDHALEVFEGGARDVHRALCVVDPVDRHLVDPQPGPLGDHQQLGVEEPAGVVHVRQHLLGDIVPHRLEAALRIAEAHAEVAVQQEVVSARDELALRPAHHARVRRQPRADGDVRVARQQRRDERRQRAQIGRQVFVEVGDHLGFAVEPCPLERPSAALLGKMDGTDPRQLERELVGDHRRRIGGGVVGDGDLPGLVEQLAERVVQRTDAVLQRRLLVEHGHHDVEPERVGGRSLGIGHESDARPGGYGGCWGRL